MAQMCRLKLFNGFDLKLFYQKQPSANKKVPNIDTMNAASVSLSNGLDSPDGINSNHSFASYLFKTEKNSESIPI